MLYPVVILAYGISGSGKTHSMDRLLRSWYKDLGGYGSVVNVLLSAVEICNSTGHSDRITDLIDQKSISLKFDPDSKEYYLDPSKHGIGRQDIHALGTLLDQVHATRKTRSTLRNKGSSRSHCIYILEGKGDDSVGFTSRHPKFCAIHTRKTDIEIGTRSSAICSILMLI